MKLNSSIKTGFSFGLTSGVITTLGLMVGLMSGTNSRIAVIGGVVTIAVADALSDSLGMHISQESDNHTKKEVWQATLSTFVFKFLFALTFLVPVLFLELTTAVLVSVVWGMTLLAILSYAIAKAEKQKPISIISEHLLIAMVVIAATYFLGKVIAVLFI